MVAGRGPLGSRDGVRALFLILVAFAAAAVAALLLGPRLVDGELARQQLVARLEAATGEPVRVLGSTNLSLWPEPLLSMDQLVIGDAARGGSTATVERVDLVLGFGGLVGLGSGPREVRLVRPQLRLLALPELAGLVRLLEGLGGEALSIDAVSVVAGLIQVRDRAVPAPLELEALDLELAREAGGGPLVLTGGGRFRGQPLAVELELRPASAGPHAVRARVTLGSGPAASRFAYRGGLELGRSPPRLDGELELAADTEQIAALLARLGAARFGERLPRIGAFAARGRLRLEKGRLASDGLRIATVAGELAARFELGLVERHDLRLELEAARLELPSGFDPAASLAELWSGPPEHLAGSVVARIGALARAGEELRLVRLDARLPGTGELVLDSLGAELPGTGDLELTGRLGRDPAGPSFRGRLAARVEDPRPLLVWLGGASALPGERLGAVAITGELSATPEGASLVGAELRLAGTRAHGTFALLVGPPLRLRLVGGVDRLVLDPWLDGTFGAAARAWLTEGPPREFETEVDLAVDRLAWRGLRAERVRLRGELAEGRLLIEELASPALGGGAVRLTGSLGPAGNADLALELAADQPARLARALELDPTLPALLEGPLAARARFRDDEVGPRFEAEITSAEGGLRADLAFLRATLDLERWRLSAELGDTAALAARLAGRGALAPGLAGRLRGEVEGRREADGWRIEGRADAARFALTGSLELTRPQGVPLLRGRLGLERVDTASLADLYRLLEVPLGLPGGPLRAWPGAWPRRPFGPPRLPPADLDLALELGFEREDGTPLGRGAATLAFAGRALALDAVDLPLAGGRLTGRLLAELGNEAGRLEAELALADGSLGALAEAIGVGEPAGGILDLELAVASEGRSLAELVGNASGRGALTLRGLTLPEPALAETKGNLSLRGPLVVERGVARGQGLAVEAEPAPGRARLTFDPAAWILDLELELPSGRLRFLGPPERLRRYAEGSSGRP
jgi:hypothetical protein